MPRVPDRYKRNREHGKAMAWGPLYDRHFPRDTDACSRHTKIVAESLRDVHSPVRRMLIDAGYEPDHWAASLELTVKMLWQERAKAKANCTHQQWEPTAVDTLEKCSVCGLTREIEQP
jgi:hypothetical protein